MPYEDSYLVAIPSLALAGVASLAPELRPLRADAEKVLKQVKPTEVTITKLDVTVDAEKSLPAATADMIVRVSGSPAGLAAQEGGGVAGPARGGDAGTFRSPGPRRLQLVSRGMVNPGGSKRRTQR